VPALPCVSLCYGRVRDRFCGFQYGSGDRGATRPARWDESAGTKRDREGWKGGVEGRPSSPYIISSPERVAIISRQWPTDRSASQKGPGPIIAATHRPRRSGQSSGALRAFSLSLSLCLSSLLFSCPRTEFLLLLPRRGPRDVDYVRTRLGETRTTGEQVIAEECVVVSDIPATNRAESNVPAMQECCVSFPMEQIVVLILLSLVPSIGGGGFDSRCPFGASKKSAAFYYRRYYESEKTGSETAKL